MPDLAKQDTQPNASQPARIDDYGRPRKTSRRQMTIAEFKQAVKLRGLNWSFERIAQEIGFAPSTICEAIQDLDDSTELATQFARGKSLDVMKSLYRSTKQAEKAGKSAPHEAMLKSSGVLGQDMSGGITIIQGGDLRDLSELVIVQQVHAAQEPYAADGLTNSSPVGFCPLPASVDGAAK